MLSSFLVEQLSKRVERSPNMTLAYYFCDDKDVKRKTGIAILRGLLLQLFRQRPTLFSHIQSDFDQQGDQLFTSFDAIYKVFSAVSSDSGAGEIYCLVDALDECEESSREAFLTSLSEIFDPPEPGRNIKIILTSRPNIDIKESLLSIHPKIQSLQLDSGMINADLSKFINVRVDELSTKKGYTLKQTQEIKGALIKKAGGTFLYVSLVLEDLSRIKIISQIKQKLKALPSTLYEMYDRILSQIDSNYTKTARFILSWVVIATHPLKVKELAMVCALNSEDWAEKTIPTQDFLDDFKDDFKCCESLLYYDTKTETVNLVHQSAKDYLLSEYLQANKKLSQYHIVADKANLLIFQICWRYLSVEEFDQGTMIINRDAENRLHQVVLSDVYLDSHTFLRYAAEVWLEHALAASPALVTDYEWERDNLDRMPTLRDTWLSRAAQCGQEKVVRLLLENGADVEAKTKDGDTVLHLMASQGREAVVQLLLEKGADVEAKDDVYGYTALHMATQEGHETVVRLLVEKGASVSKKVEGVINSGWTALHFASCHGYEVVVRLLVNNGADVEAKDNDGNTPLHYAAWDRSEAVLRLLLEIGANIEAKNNDGRTAVQKAAGCGQEAAVRLLLDHTGVESNSEKLLQTAQLHNAVGRGDEATVRLLLEKGADVTAKDNRGGTALHWAAENGHKAVVSLLLEKGEDIEAKDTFGATALHIAAERGHEAMVQLLLEKGADIKAKDETGEIALHYAAENGHEAVVRLLLEKGDDVNAEDKNGTTPLVLAAWCGHEAVVHLLLERGANLKSTILETLQKRMDVKQADFEATMQIIKEWQAPNS